ncbi:MAG: redox-sensing transcriptional repressor Rex [Phycisphaerae bacterium]
MKAPIPKAVVYRLPLYLRRLEYLNTDGVETVSSRSLAESLGLKDAQVRKDLAYFGTFGRPGVGYPVRDLIDRLREILGTDHTWRLALVGFGNLGRALLSYRGFRRKGFHIEAVFDADRAKIGRRAGDLVVQDVANLVPEIRRRRLPLAILAVPAEAAQQVATELVRAEIAGILNFAPVSLDLPPNVPVNNVDLAVCLEQLTFHVSKR